MPLPIKPINDGSSKGNDSLFMDYSFLNNLGFSIEPETKVASRKFVEASNKDASSLYTLWQEGIRESNGNDFDIQQTIEAASLSARDISRLKALGFLKGDREKVAFTDRGKRLLVTMTLSEPNRFGLKAERKPYNEILAKMTVKKHKTGGRITYASSSSNNIDLRKTGK